MADDHDAVVAFISAQQRSPERNVIYLGEEADGIRAELAVLQPEWTTTVRVAAADGGTIVGAALAEWDDEVGRAWVLGPWVAGDGNAWTRWARPLFDAVATQVPAAIVDRELAGSLANERLADLAAELGWHPTAVSYSYVLDGDVGSGWPADDRAGTPRTAGEADLPAIAALHDGEFPATYLTAAQLLERAGTGEALVLVAEGPDGEVAGYAAGNVQPDGDGYIDFLAVDVAARGGGIGRRLVLALGRRLLVASSSRRVHLTVHEHRTPARALYASLGFRVGTAIRGYRSVST